MKHPLTSLMIAAALFAVPATAIADAHRGSFKDAPMHAAPVNWSGFHIGMALGYSTSDAELTRDLFLVPGASVQFPAGVTDRDVSDTEPDGVTGTITLGYDRLLGSHLLAGVFADYTFGSHSDGGTAIEPGAGLVSYSVDVDSTWAVGGRIGYLVRPQTLVYVSGGYTETDIDLRSNNQVFEEDLGGYFVGGGIVHQLRGGLGLTLDYRYSDFDSQTFFNQQQFLNGTLCCTERIDIESENHAIRIGLTYRFPSRRPIAHTPLK
ncbi:MAG: outer membrane beta-barrel protein [Pseudomonadota bacterium]